MRSKTRAILLLALVVIASFTISYLLSSSYWAPARTITITKTAEITYAAPDEEYEKAVQSLLDHVMAWVESHRGLHFREDVSIVVLTRDWVMEHWGAGGLNITQVKIEEILLKSLFIVPEDFNLTEFKVQVSGYMVAGAADHTIYVVKDFFNPSDRLSAGATLAHELTHILQGEYFELPSPTSYDERNALNALVEGDAGLVGSQYLIEHGGERRGGYSESQLKPLDALWLFPYIYGEPFVRYAYERGGWSLVDALYQDPPRSTAQVLHPEKYLGGWKPVRVDPPPPPGDGWRLILRDVLGEYFIRQVLRAHLDGLTANRSAEGWLGDILQLYERDGSYMLTWRILWESEGEAREFADSFAKLLRGVGASRLDEETWIAGSRRITFRAEGRVTTLTIILTQGST